jgi:putative sigma-54 modulation protein
MRMDIRGRNVEVTEDLHEMVRKRFQRLGRQVSDLATLDVVLSEERNPSIADNQIAEATFHLKGVTLRAHECSPQMTHSIHELAEDLQRQVKKHRDLRRNRRQTRKLVERLRGRPATT